MSIEELEQTIYSFSGLTELLAIASINRSQQRVIKKIAAAIITNHFKRHRYNGISLSEQLLSKNALAIASQLTLKTGYSPQRELTHTLPTMPYSVVHAPHAHEFLVQPNTRHNIHLRLDRPNRQIRSQLLEGHACTVSVMAYAPNGKTIITGSNDASIIVWRKSTAQQWHSCHHYQAHRTHVSSLAHHPTQEEFVTGGAWDRTVYTWTRQENGEYHCHRYAHHHIGGITVIAYDPLGRYFVTGAHDHRVAVWTSHEGRYHPCMLVSEHTSTLSHLCHHPLGRYFITVSNEGTAQLWNKTTKNTWRSITKLCKQSASETHITAIAHHPGKNEVLVGFANGLVQQWDTENPHRFFQSTVLAYSNTPRVVPVTCLRYNPDASCILIGNSQGIMYLNEKNQKGLWEKKQTLNQHQAPITDITFSPDGLYLVSTSTDQRCRLWTRTSSKNLKSNATKIACTVQ